jgi:hypothetical protein
VEPFRDGIGVARERAERAESERDELRRESDELRARLAEVEAAKRPPRRKPWHVVVWVAVYALAGWLAAKVFVPRAWVTPPAPPTESSGARVEWSVVERPYGEVTGVTTLDGPVLFGRFGALTFPELSRKVLRVRDEHAPIDGDVLAGARLPGEDGPLIVVGRNGAAARRTGDRTRGDWVVERTGVEQDLLSAVARGPEVFAVGDDGIVVRRSATGEWAAESSGTKVRLRAVAVASRGRRSAVGDEGVIAERDASGSWKILPSPTTSTLRALAVADGGRLFAAGDHGTLLEERPGDGSKWAAVELKLAGDIVATTTHEDDVILAATRQGDVLAFQPATRSFVAAKVTTKEPIGLVSDESRIVLVTTHGDVHLGRAIGWPKPGK